MCTQETRQEIAFLLALYSTEEPATPSEIASLMQLKLQELEWPTYFVRSPKPLDGLIQRAEQMGHIGRFSPFAWRINPAGENRASYIIERFVPDSEKRKLRSAMRVVA